MTDTHDNTTRDGTPERIWDCLTYCAGGQIICYPYKTNPDEIGYIREDVAERMAQARVTAALKEAADAISNLPENGRAGPPQDNVDRLLDAQKREDVKAILALIPDAAAALDRAIAAEREACAKVARRWGAQFEPHGYIAMGDDELKINIACQIAAAIRARTEGEG